MKIRYVLILLIAVFTVSFQAGQLYKNARIMQEIGETLNLCEPR